MRGKRIAGIFMILMGVMTCFVCRAAAQNVNVIDNNWKVQLSALTPSDAPNEEAWVNKPLPYFVHQGADSMWLEKTVAIPSEAGKRYWLEFSDLQCDAIVYVKTTGDFVKLSELKGPECRLDITSSVTPGAPATIRIWVTRWWVGTQNTRNTDYFRNAQILNYANLFKQEDASFKESLCVGVKGGIKLIQKNAAAEITNIVVRTDVRNEKLELIIDGTIEGFSGAKVTAQVSELGGQTAGLPFAEKAYGGGRLTIEIPWEDPRLWELGDAYLYNLDVKILDSSNNEMDCYPTVRFGFREIWIEGKDMYLNGHILRLRIAPFTTGGVNGMMFYEGMGFNTILIQPNTTYWWGAKYGGLFPSEEYSFQYLSKAMTDYADEHGWAVLMSAPSVDVIGSIMVTNTDVQEQYLEYLNMWMKINDYQNRPSIISWTPSMNSGGTYDPEGLGQAPAAAHGNLDQAKVKQKAESMIKEMDPTRFIYSHHGGYTDMSWEEGGVSDIDTLNMYSNHMPLQELEEYLSYWAENGKRPWGSCEFGIGLPLDFFNNGRVLPQFTEYLARYYGDASYTAQTNNYVNASAALINSASTVNYKTTKFTGMDYFTKNRYFEHLHNWTLIGRYLGDYTERVMRSWRTYGLNYGAFPFNMGVGFGIAPDAYLTGDGYVYPELRNHPNPQSLLTERPSWANLYYDQFKAVSQPLLVYIGGKENHFVEKGHNFVSGETVEKSIILIWDGPNGKNVRVDWTFKTAAGLVDGGHKVYNLSAGDIVIDPLQLIAPSVSAKTNAFIEIAVSEDGGGANISSDRFELTFFPEPATPAPLTKTWAIYDIVGTTANELADFGLDIQPFYEGDSVDGIDVLIIGTGTARDADVLPYTAEDVENGLCVLFMEQDLDGLERLGFRASDNIPRYVFPRVKEHPLLNGLDQNDLSNWRGAGILLPETSDGKGQWVVNQAHHWKNTGSVASVTIEIPHMGTFTPVADAEFDLSYTPLLSWTHGKGEIIFSQFDINGRLELEPAAAVLMKNIVTYLDARQLNEAVQSKRLVYVGDSLGDMEFLAALGFEISESSSYQDLNTQTDILVIGELPSNTSEISSFVNSGGTAVTLPQWKYKIEISDLATLLQMTERQINQVKPAQIDSGARILTGIGANLLNFRKNIPLLTFKDGLLDGLLFEKNGANGGKWLFSQVDWRALGTDTDNIIQTHNIQQPKMNMYRFYRQLFTNLGAVTLEQLAENLCGKDL